MRLSKRLKAICDFVPENRNVIDIGTDHGYVPIYLTKIKNCNCTATDISLKSLSKAIENAKKANVHIKFVCTDGLKNININNEIIIISGMGTKNILHILSVDLTNDLIISSNNDSESLIDKMKQRRYYVHKKMKVLDGKDYTIVYFKKNNQ